jgi:DNA-3-methyladenine glycosylase
MSCFLADLKTTMTTKLGRDFYLQPTLTVAKELLGKVFILKRGRNTLSGRIVETEAYIGEDDPACHARFGMTKRNSIMYGMGGHTYVYFVYGMYNMLNFVTEGEGFPAAVLIRAMEPLEGIDLMKRQRGCEQEQRLTSGPGKLCQALGLTVKDTGLDLTGSKASVIDDGYRSRNIVKTPRIGIRQGQELLWRFYDNDSRFVSAKRKYG